MNPRDRRLRLRKSTVSKLNPDSASHARGGVEIVPSGFFCTYEETCLTCACPTNTCPRNCLTYLYTDCDPSCDTCADWNCPIG
jgi:hypothetical protein